MDNGTLLQELQEEIDKAVNAAFVGRVKSDEQAIKLRVITDEVITLFLAKHALDRCWISRMKSLNEREGETDAWLIGL